MIQGLLLRLGIRKGVTALAKGPETPTLDSAPIRIKAKLKINRSLNQKMNRAIDDKVETVMNYARDQVAPLTPKDSGNAQRGWHTRGKGKNMILQNLVPYIERLEAGWSKQAPNGMLKRLEKLIRRKFT